MRILVIEDEVRMAELVCKGLAEHGHAVMTAMDGAEGLKLTLDHDFDVVLLDVGLPGLSGCDVAQVLRERQSTASILMLTAFDKEDDIVRGLNLGADDYLTKPFSFPELLARLRSVTRPAPEALPTTYVAGDLVLDRIRRRANRAGRAIELTRTEFALLERLMSHAPQVISRKTLIDSLWGGHGEVSSGALDVLVNSLRGKLDAPFREKLIQTVRGTGYAVNANIVGARRPFAINATARSAPQ
jgi:DNA-binding response OmpR family regulator